jgi:phosphate-transporting ATPase
MLSVRALTRPGLDATTFRIADGECIAVRGASGSGKTLLLRAIADLDPNAGEVMLDDAVRESMPAPDWRRRVVYVAAEPGWWHDTVAEHFDDWGAVRDLATATGLPDDCREWPIARLSTGERQRLGLMRALALGPRVLLLDEPTSGLDDAATEAVEGLIRARLDGGTSVVWVTHDDAQARRLARRALVVTDGVVAETAA